MPWITALLARGIYSIFMGGTTNGIACDTMGQPHLMCCYPDRSRLGSDHRNKRKPTRHASPSQPLQCDNPHTSRANEQPLLLRADEQNSDERRKTPRCHALGQLNSGGVDNATNVGLGSS